PSVKYFTMDWNGPSALDGSRSPEWLPGTPPPEAAGVGANRLIKYRFDGQAKCNLLSKIPHLLCKLLGRGVGGTRVMASDKRSSSKQDRTFLRCPRCSGPMRFSCSAPHREFKGLEVCYYDCRCGHFESRLFPEAAAPAPPAAMPPPRRRRG